MYNLILNGHASEYELKELVKIWPPDDSIELNIKIPDSSMTKNEAKRFIFETLSGATGYRPEWGILTGVRPTKLVNEYLDSGMSKAQVIDLLSKEYKISREKISLLMETCTNQRHITSVKAQKTVGVYIGIPFCPTRCVYCSFTSNQADKASIDLYLNALFKEISYVGKAMAQRGMLPESVYIGGGTPTTLDSMQLTDLLRTVGNAFDLSALQEFCVEAGRPDTIDPEKISVLKDFEVDRISINPQSMNQKTLDIIGRSHKVEDIIRAFAATREKGIEFINTDIIAGLPGETVEDFIHTLDEVIALYPSNITVHTLAVKRASKLKEINENYHYDRTKDVGIMVDTARLKLSEAGFEPYYLYRQKHMTGNYENVGYTKKGAASVYNVRIMDEHQTIVALGAGGISKAYYPDKNRLERIPNVSNYTVYIDRIADMIQRKKDKLFTEENNAN